MGPQAREGLSEIKFGLCKLKALEPALRLYLQEFEEVGKPTLVLSFKICFHEECT